MLQLPSIIDPFPVNVPFKIEVDLYKVGRPLHGQPEDLVFMFDQNYERIITEKLDLFQEFPDHSLCYLTDDLANLETCLWQLAEAIAKEHPAYTTCDATGFGSTLLALKLTRTGQVEFRPDASHFPALAERAYNHLLTLPPFERLCIMLAVSVEEDLTIIRDTVGGKHTDQAECLIVAIPTHWTPADKLGLNFSEIHAPVSENEPLKRSHTGLMKAMINKGPFVRYNWALADSDALSLNPVLLGAHSLEFVDLTNLASPTELLDILRFRVERQTFLHFPALQRGLFTLHIFQRPLRESLTTPERVAQLADAVASMSPAIREYRSMTDFADQLVEVLRDYYQQMVS